MKASKLRHVSHQFGKKHRGKQLAFLHRISSRISAAHDIAILLRRSFFIYKNMAFDHDTSCLHGGGGGVLSDIYGWTVLVPSWASPPKETRKTKSNNMNSCCQDAAAASCKKKRKHLLNLSAVVLVMLLFTLPLEVVATQNNLKLSAEDSGGGGGATRWKRDALQVNNKQNGNTVAPTEVSEDLKYQRYDNFPVPKVENVYKAWKPVDHGHPLRDATLFYAPPSLERVKLLRSNNGPESRSIDGDPRPVSDLFPQATVVIPAKPKTEAKNYGYSVYGSPHINYSKLYSQPAIRLPTHDRPIENGRESPYLAFQRDYFNSAKGSRSADTVELPSRHPTVATNSNRRSRPHGGGIQFMTPPNRKKATEYFYYSDDSEYYKAKLAIVPEGSKKEEAPANNEIISIDGIVVDQKAESSRKRTEDLTPAPSERRTYYARRPEAKKTNAVVYSFKNNYGQKEQVGIIYDDNSNGPQVNKVFGSNKELVSREGPKQEHRAIPLGDHQRPQFYRQTYQQSPPQFEKSRNQVQNGRRAPARVIPLRNKPASGGSKRKVYPLGNPYQTPLIKARPDFFPPLSHPPLYQTKPQHLEGVFGPALPPKPEPDVINFPDEDLAYANPGPPPPPPPRANRRNDVQQNNLVYKTVRDMDYVRPPVILHIKDSGELFNPSQDTLHAPAGDVRPRVPILPGHGTLEEWQKRQQQSQHHQEQPQPVHHQEQEDVVHEVHDPWQADFTDAINDSPSDLANSHPFPAPFTTPKPVPKLSDVFGSSVAHPLDLDTEPSQTDHVIFRESSSSSFKFPGPSSSSQENHKRPFREVSSSSNTQTAPDKKVKRVHTITKNGGNANSAVVIGLEYDDAVEYDHEEEDYPVVEEGYSKEELYRLCIKEVPPYLRSELCGGLRFDTAQSRQDTLKQRAKSAENLPPIPSQLLQGQPLHSGHQDQNTIEFDLHTGQFVDKKQANPFFGIPTELPVQINKLDDPLVITGSSKVKIYRPSAEPPTVQTMTTSLKTTTTTTTTTVPQVLGRHKPREQRPRPLIFNKRDPETGQSALSKPFEYFNRLTHFFSNRVQARHQPQNRQHQRPPPPPRLIRQRVQS